MDLKSAEEFGLPKLPEDYWWKITKTPYNGDNSVTLTLRKKWWLFGRTVDAVTCYGDQQNIIRVAEVIVKYRFRPDQRDELEGVYV